MEDIAQQNKNKKKLSCREKLARSSAEITPFVLLKQVTFWTDNNITMSEYIFEHIFIMSHVALCLNNRIVVFGGIDYKFGDESDIPMHTIFMYNLHTEQWRKHHIPDDKPTPRARACAAAIGQDIYMFGGWNFFYKRII